MLFQILGQHLRSGAHDAAHCGLKFADAVVITIAVAINHLKLKLLLLLEEIRHHHNGQEVWVQLILDLFSLSAQDPLVVNHLVDHALRVRLAERVQILELPS